MAFLDWALRTLRKRFENLGIQNGCSSVGAQNSILESTASLVSSETVVYNLDTPLLSHFRTYYPLCAFGLWPGFVLWGGGLLPSDPFSFQLPPASPRVWCRAGYRVKQTMGFGRSIYFKHDASITVLFATATYLIVLIIGSEVFEIMILKLKY